VKTAVFRGVHCKPGNPLARLNWNELGKEEEKPVVSVPLPKLAIAGAI
jgi:hypothetical protein